MPSSKDYLVVGAVLAAVGAGIYLAYRKPTAPPKAGIQRRYGQKLVFKPEIRNSSDITHRSIAVQARIAGQGQDWQEGVFDFKPGTLIVSLPAWVVPGAFPVKVHGVEARLLDQTGKVIDQMSWKDQVEVIA